MVTACKEFITDGGLTKIWDQPRKPLIEKLESCIRLNQEYQQCFQKTKQRIEENPGQKPFEFSEMYIFGKFDTFCRRLQRVITYSLFSLFFFSYRQQIALPYHNKWISTIDIVFWEGMQWCAMMQEKVFSMKCSMLLRL